MPALSPRWHRASLQLFLYLAALILSLLYFLHRFHADFGGLPPFWDAHVYARALAQWRVGLNPYLPSSPTRPDTVLPFVSPPVFLYAAAALRHLAPGQAGFALYCVFSGLCTLAVPTLLACFYLRSRWITPALALLVTWFQPGRHGSQAFLTGNISNVLYAALLAAGIPGIRRNRWWPFYAVLFIAGVLKPPFLAFLLLPLLAGHRQWLQSTAVILAVLAADIAQKLALPGRWHDFQQGVIARILTHGDAGFGLLGQWLALAPHLGPLQHLSASVGVLLILIPLLAFAFLLRNRRLHPATGFLWLPCLLVLAILCNPRILDYDINVAIAPAVFLAVEFFLCLPPTPYRSLLIGIPLLFFLGLESTQEEAALCALLIASVLMAFAHLLWPNYFRAPATLPGTPQQPPSARNRHTLR